MDFSSLNTDFSDVDVDGDGELSTGEEVKLYLKQLGVTADLGTPEAKAQWKPIMEAVKEHASQFGGESTDFGHGGLTNILVTDIMVKQGVSWDVAQSIAADIRNKKYGKNFPWEKYSS